MAICEYVSITIISIRVQHPNCNKLVTLLIFLFALFIETNDTNIKIIDKTNPPFNNNSNIKLWAVLKPILKEYHSAPCIPYPTHGDSLNNSMA